MNLFGSLRSQASVFRKVNDIVCTLLNYIV